MPRHIRCPRCALEGSVPEGRETGRVRCPNADCRHVFEIGRGAEPAIAGVPAGTATDAASRPPAASAPARPSHRGAGMRTERGVGSPSKPGAARRPAWRTAETLGWLAMILIVVGIGALAMRDGGGDGARR